jgi:stage II sporulation protein E
MEQIEVYPFQRIKETPGQRWLAKKGQLLKVLRRAMLKWMPHGVNLSQVGKSLLRMEVLILCLMSFVMARAALLGELLPFMFAFLAAYSRKQPVVGMAMGLAACIGLINQSVSIGLAANIASVFLLISIINYSKLPADKYWWGIPFVCTATVFLVKSLFLLKMGMSFYGEMVIIFESLMDLAISLALSSSPAFNTLISIKCWAPSPSRAIFLAKVILTKSRASLNT